jgi:hypothetical protein
LRCLRLPRLLAAARFCEASGVGAARETAGCFPVARLRRRDDDSVMPSPSLARVWFEIDWDSDPIGGRVYVTGAPVRPFSGWLELIALIEETRSGLAAEDRNDARSRFPSGDDGRD